MITNANFSKAIPMNIPCSTKCLHQASLPKLVACVDIKKLSLEKIIAIAKSLGVPDYDFMTDEQLCDTLLNLSIPLDTLAHSNNNVKGSQHY